MFRKLNKFFHRQPETLDSAVLKTLLDKKSYTIYRRLRQKNFSVVFTVNCWRCRFIQQTCPPKLTMVVYPLNSSQELFFVWLPEKSLESVLAIIYSNPKVLEQLYVNRGCGRIEHWYASENKTIQSQPQ